MIPTRPFGPLDREVPVIGIGTWNMERDRDREAVRAIRRSVELGACHVDTAELYGNGKVERIVGRATEDIRDEVFLASKVLPHNANRKGVLTACDNSLLRLNTHYLDLYLLHWWDGDYPLEQTFESFETLRERGKIRAWGVSNFDVPELEAALRAVGPGKIACNQVLYHLGERSIERRVLPWCEEHGVAVVGYSPFGSGDFPAPDSPGGQVLAAVAAIHDATPRQVALAFLTRRPSLFAIPKTADWRRAGENAKAADLQLTASDIARIDAAFPLGPAPDELPTL